MTREFIFSRIAAILTTMLEVGHPAPESSLYMAMDCNLQDYTAIRNLLTASGLVTRKNDQLSLTFKGRETAEACAKVKADAKAKIAATR